MNLMKGKGYLAHKLMEDGGEWKWGKEVEEIRRLRLGWPSKVPLMAASHIWSHGGVNI